MPPGLVGQVNLLLSEQIFHFAIAQRKAELESHDLLDHGGREAPAAAGDLIRLPKLPHQPSRNRYDSATMTINGHCVAAGFEICSDW